MPEVLSLNAAKKQQRRGKRSAADALSSNEQECPVTALGHVNGTFWFLSIENERRCLSARQMGAKPEIISLFLGDTQWLKSHFPSFDFEGNSKDFSAQKACEFLMSECRRAGIYGDHVIIRKPGVWAGDDGALIVHCGDALFIDGEKRSTGEKFAGQIFAAGPRQPYPAPVTASAQVGQSIQSDIRTLWDFRDDGADIIAIGLVGQAYYAAGLSWRANGFVTGASNAGKSKLLAVLHNMVPISHYSTDTSKAGIEGAVNGRAMPTFLDEATDRGGGQGAINLLDVVLSASSGTGTKGHRGTVDGGVRTIEMVGCVIMAAVTPPPMQPQHRSRFTLIELLKPKAGADHNAAMTAAAERAKASGPALFARAMAGFARYTASLRTFRVALGHAGCVAREMDQLGAILAGYWVLTQDGEPSGDDAAQVVGDIAGYVRGADVMAEDDAPQLVLAKLQTTVVQLNRSTETETLARLLETAMKPDSGEPGEISVRNHARKILEKVGIKLVCADEKNTCQGNEIYRLGPSGLWINPHAEPLRGIFHNTPYEGDRWVTQIMRLPSARRSKKAVRIGGFVSKPIWVSWDDIYGNADVG